MVNYQVIHDAWLPTGNGPHLGTKLMSMIKSGIGVQFKIF
jgi:hypothetical protein